MQNKHQRGFSLMEMVIVVGIIVTLSATGAYSATTLIKNARAAKITEDFKRLDAAWTTWRLDTQIMYPDEDDFNGLAPAHDCGDEISVEGTDIYQDVEGLPHWNGPYIVDKLRDPWGNTYSYDNDSDVDDTPNATCLTTRGVNIFLLYCADEVAKYEALAPIIDRTIDNGDGLCEGTFRTFTYTSGPFAGGGGLIYNLAEQGQ